MSMLPILTVYRSLPADFRQTDVLAMHARDGEAISERVLGQRIDKAIFWQGEPTMLQLDFSGKSADHGVEISLLARSQCTNAESLNPKISAALIQLADNMLGLSQPISAFERQYHQHPELGTVIQHNAGLRIPNSSTPFESLVWAIVGQLVSVAAAVSMRRRLIQLTSPEMAVIDDLRPFPLAKHLSMHTPEQLASAGLTRSKAETLHRLSAQMVAGDLPEVWDEPAKAQAILSTLSLDKLRTKLLSIKGIGEWTVNYVLMRGYGFLDGELHGDVAVRRNLQTLLGLPERPSIAETRDWLAHFSPYRGIIAAHLWAMQSEARY